MRIRKAAEQDIEAVERIFEDVHTEEEAGRTSIGWVRGIYPTRQTAEAALQRQDLFVLAENGMIAGTAIINQLQVDSYKGAGWQYDVPDDQVMVLHTLAISPHASGRGLGRSFVAYYEEYARDHGCRYLRMDTNEKNARARKLYRRLGYQEIGIIPCTFNGIEGVRLVLLEKCLQDSRASSGEFAASHVLRES